MRLINGEETIKVVYMADHADGFIVWFFGNKHELLEGTCSKVLDHCSHRIFKCEYEYKKSILQPLKKQGWSHLKTI